MACVLRQSCRVPVFEIQAFDISDFDVTRSAWRARLGSRSCILKERSLNETYWLTSSSGILIAASVLVAAGIAVYEHPQVQEWFEKTRRKIAIAINNIGEGPRPAGPSDEEVAAAVAAARRKRDEILARKRELFVRQLASGGASWVELEERETGRFNFDDFLNSDGAGAYTLHNTSSDRPQTVDQFLRHRANVGVSEPSVNGEMTETNQTQSEAQVLFDAGSVGEHDTTQHDDEEATDHQPAADPAHEQDDTQPLIQLDPEVESQSSSIVLATPASSYSGHSWPLETSMQQPTSTSTYHSINEWAESTSPTVNVPPPYTVLSSGHLEDETSPAEINDSMHGSLDDYAVEISGDVHDTDAPFSDIISQTSGMHTPATWTEVGSEVSEGDFGEGAQ